MVRPMQARVNSEKVIKPMPIKRDKNGRWRYREMVKLPNGTRQRISGSAPKHCNTKAAAKQAMLDHVERLRNPNYQSTTELEKEAPIFKDFAQDFMEKYAKVNNKNSEIVRKGYTLRLHLNPEFGELRLDEIKSQCIETYKAKKKEQGYAWQTINHHLNILHRILAIAHEWELLDSVVRIKKLKGAEAPFDFLDFAEAELLANSVQGQWGAMIFFAMRTGLRIGELRELRWEDINLDAGRVLVRRSIVYGVIGTPKSGKERIVPLSQETLERLHAHRHDNDLVFCQSNGSHLASDACYRALQSACRTVGLRRFGWHVLRHTFASHLAMRGVPLKVIQELLGHATIQMTMRYAHLSPAMHRNAVDLLDFDNGNSVAKKSEDDHN